VQALETGIRNGSPHGTTTPGHSPGTKPTYEILNSPADYPAKLRQATPLNEQN